MSSSAGAETGDETPRRKRPRDREDAERQAHEAADVVRLGGAAGAALADGAVPEAVRAPVEAWTGTDLSHVRLDTNTDPRTIAGDAGLIAAADPSTVYTGLAGPLRGTRLAEQVLVHELVHTAQLAQTPALADGSAHRMRPLGLGFCGSSAPAPPAPAPVVDPFDKLRSGGPLTQADASSLLTTYEHLSTGDRDRIIGEFHRIGSPNDGVRRLLSALDPAEMERRRDLVSDLQERVQRLAVEATSGHTLAELGVTEGANMRREAEAQALAEARAAARRRGAPPPAVVNPGDVARAHDAETRRTSPIESTITNAWDALGAGSPAQLRWNARAAAVITRVVAACNRRAPELHITSANLKWAPHEVAQDGANVYAFSGDPISFGMNFVETAEANPDYCVRTVVHEIAGHPDFGDSHKSPEAIIYENAHTAEPSLGSPWDTEEEENTFGYIATEIYAALREVPYDVPLTAADNLRGLGAITIVDNIDNKVGLVKSKFTLPTATALVQGLYERFRVDPRVTPAALAIYVAQVEKHFGRVLRR